MYDDMHTIAIYIDRIEIISVEIVGRYWKYSILIPNIVGNLSKAINTITHNWVSHLYYIVQTFFPEKEHNKTKHIRNNSIVQR